MTEEEDEPPWLRKAYSSFLRRDLSMQASPSRRSCQSSLIGSDEDEEPVWLASAGAILGSIRGSIRGIRHASVTAETAQKQFSGIAMPMRGESGGKDHVPSSRRRLVALVVLTLLPVLTLLGQDGMHPPSRLRPDLQWIITRVQDDLAAAPVAWGGRSRPAQVSTAAWKRRGIHVAAGAVLGTLLRPFRPAVFATFGTLLRPFQPAAGALLRAILRPLVPLGARVRAAWLWLVPAAHRMPSSVWAWV